ncbi:MAG: hypothetical protein D6752_00400 [Candidatus Nitrosothermus koennekii]|nr:MAG: hypothetical protein D6752_00400 [Candidatus Nitrosothermus koennekii]
MAVTVSSRIRIAEGLSIAGLILLIIYGADAAVGQGKTGFLPMDEMTRGIGFGGGAVALSIAAFFVSLRERSNITSILLIINGILILIGGISAVVFSEGGNAAGAYGVLAMGIIVLAMGIIKILRKA